MKYIRLASVLIIGVLFSLRSLAQATPVFADPALGSFDITDMNNVSVDANNLLLNGVYNIRLDVANFNFTNPIPANTAFVDIFLGTKLVLDPSYNLSTAPLSNYFTFVYTTAGQPKIRCIITSPVPADFFSQLVFRVKTTVSGTSNITGNFSVANNNPAFTLSDDNSGNNTASLSYIVSSVLSATVSDVKTSVKDCNADISWKAGPEINLANYEVEYSNDGIEFVKALSVPAEHKNSYGVSFSLSDKIKSSKIFIRLKCIDMDGSFKYTPIISTDVSCNKELSTAFCYPNPLGDSPDITIALKEGNFSGDYLVSLIDTGGSTYFGRHMVLNDTKSFQLPIGKGLAAGKYFVVIRKISGDAVNIIVSFVKE